MSELIKKDNLDNSVSDYIVPQRALNVSDAWGEFVDVYYITDLHIDFHIDRELDEETQIQKLVDGLFKRYIDRFESIVYVGGDVANSIRISEIFYKHLRNRFSDIEIVAVLGNHEISEFQTIDEAVEKYSLLFEKYEIGFLHNSYFEMRTCSLEEAQSFLCVGGIGFAPFNNNYNADSLIASNDIQFDREKEIAESNKFLSSYHQALNEAIQTKKLLLVFTHYPINHHNEQYIKNGSTIVADNQIGYKKKQIKFKHIKLGTIYNPFFDYLDGHYQINVDDYIMFYRFNDVPISGCSLIMSLIEKGNTLYMIKKHGFYMFVIVGEKHSWLCVGGQIKKIKNINSIEYFYDSFDDMVNTCFELFGSTYNELTMISEELKKYGLDGRVHGLIVDVDKRYHIMFNPFEHRLVFYYSPYWGLAKTYSGIKPLLKELKIDTTRDDFFTAYEYKQWTKQIDRAIKDEYSSSS